MPKRLSSTWALQNFNRTNYRIFTIQYVTSLCCPLLQRIFGEVGVRSRVDHKELMVVKVSFDRSEQLIRE
jgi:hypothetical protein